MLELHERKGHRLRRKKWHGGYYFIVSTHRGPRARQVAAEGVAVLRARYPGRPSLDGLQVDDDTFSELQDSGYIYTQIGRQRDNRKRPARQRPVAPFDAPVVPPVPAQAQSASAAASGAAAAATATVTAPASRAPQPVSAPAVAQCPACAGGRKPRRDGARFCPRCGRSAGMVQPYQPEPVELDVDQVIAADVEPCQPERGFGFFVVFAFVVAVLVAATILRSLGR